jgi:aryl-alcohol dehydrogenase-like predicted oxidoreductase
MELKQLGKTGLYVSRLSLGTMTLGEADKTSIFYGIGCSKDEAFKIIDHAIESGINFLDTANVYGQDGMVEKLLGSYFLDRKNRKNLVLATKFRFSMGDLPHQSGASRKHILEAVEGSLMRLGTDFIDLYQVHMQDINTPEEETLRALDDLVRQGKVRYIGASNYTAHRFLAAHYTSLMHNLTRYCSLQMQYNLLCRDIEREHVPLCIDHGMGILVWSPLAGGFLSGKYSASHVEKGTRLSVKQDGISRFDKERNYQIVDTVKRIADACHATPSQISLAWLLGKPGVASVIVGARKVSQLKDNLASASLLLSEAHMRELDDVSALPPVYPYDFIWSKQKKP